MHGGVSKTRMSILAQLKAWRSRWRMESSDDAEERERLLNRSFAIALNSPSGKDVQDYLIETYYRPLKFIGPTDGGRSLERNGEMNVVVDILERIDRGLHPSAFEPEHSSDDEKEVDVRL